MKRLFLVIFSTVNGGYAATTREKGGIGLPGGKVEEGETLTDALMRECYEEGWDFNIVPNGLVMFHSGIVKGKDIGWFTVNTIGSINGKKLVDWKEKDRGINPIIVSLTEIRNSGYGNDEAVKAYRKFIMEKEL